MNFLKRKKIKITDLEKATDNTLNKEKNLENNAVSEDNLGKCYGAIKPKDAEAENYHSGC